MRDSLSVYRVEYIERYWNIYAGIDRALHLTSTSYILQWRLHVMKAGVDLYAVALQETFCWALCVKCCMRSAV